MRDITIARAEVLQSRVVAVACFRPVPPCYRRHFAATSQTPPARISRLRPAAYGQRRGGGCARPPFFPELFQGKNRDATVAFARCRCCTASLPHASRGGH